MNNLSRVLFHQKVVFEVFLLVFMKAKQFLLKVQHLVGSGVILTALFQHFTHFVSLVLSEELGSFVKFKGR